MSGWKDSLHSYAVQPIQQFRYTVRKECHGQRNDHRRKWTYCTQELWKGSASSPATATTLGWPREYASKACSLWALVVRSRQKSFVNACEVFVYTENLYPEGDDETPRIELESSDWTETVARAVEMATQDDGWARLSTVGANLLQLDPAFDSRSYGHTKLSLLVKSRPSEFQVKGSQNRKQSSHNVCEDKGLKGMLLVILAWSRVRPNTSENGCKETYEKLAFRTPLPI